MAEQPRRTESLRRASVSHIQGTKPGWRQSASRAGTLAILFRKLGGGVKVKVVDETRRRLSDGDGGSSRAPVVSGTSDAWLCARTHGDPPTLELGRAAFDTEQRWCWQRPQCRLKQEICASKARE